MNKIKTRRQDDSLTDSTLRKVAQITLKTLFLVLLTAFALLQIFPFWLKLVESFQPIDQYLDPTSFHFWPKSFNLSNYGTAFIESDLGIGYLNSILVTVIYIVISSVIIVLCGYVFAIKEFRGKKFVFFLFLATMMVPGEVLMIPNYELIVGLGLDSTLAAVILPGLVNVFGMFLVKQYMSSIPNSLFESARLDGANELQVIVRIVTPLAMPVIATYVILTSVSTWNDFLWPYLVLNDSSVFTVQLKLYMFSSFTGTSRDQILKSAGVMLVTIPVVIVYLVFQKQFIKGIAISGLK